MNDEERLRLLGLVGRIDQEIAKCEDMKANASERGTKTAMKAELFRLRHVLSNVQAELKKLSQPEGEQ